MYPHMWCPSWPDSRSGLSPRSPDPPGTVWHNPYSTPAKPSSVLAAASEYTHRSASRAAPLCVCGLSAPWSYDRCLRHAGKHPGAPCGLDSGCRTVAMSCCRPPAPVPSSVRRQGCSSTDCYPVATCPERRLLPRVRPTSP